MTSGLQLEVIRGDAPAVIVTYDQLDFRLGTDNQLAEIFTMSARAGTPGMPSLEGVTFNEVSERAPDVLPYIHILKVSGEPATFEYERFGFGTRIHGGGHPQYFGELVPRLGPKLWSSLAGLYADAAFRGRISLSEIHASARGEWFAYRRLVMPLSSNGRDIDKVLCAIVHNTFELEGLLPGDLVSVNVNDEHPVLLACRSENP
ncbi:PAS domain-containing protein [Nisaea sediminum]|uniref:hypothetical protein n=1 Tax=Nisaea sediminum TaxID=2775867 RepID=UPI0018672C28|nr:hypothetical protein [Nisaea sediminum]